MANLYFNGVRSVFRFDSTLEGLVWTGYGASIVFRDGEQVIPASYGSSVAPEFHLDEVKFGDGYEQVTESGINAVQDTFTVLFTNKRKEISLALKRFFSGEGENSVYSRRPSEWFYWLPPESLGDNEFMRVRCVSFNQAPSTYNAWNTTAEFKRSFEP